MFGRQVTQKVGSLVGVHLVQHVRQTFQSQILGGIQGILVLQLVEKIGSGWNVQMLKQDALFVIVERVEDLGLISGAQFEEGSCSLTEALSFQRFTDMFYDEFEQMWVSHGGIRDVVDCAINKVRRTYNQCVAP